MAADIATALWLTVASGLVASCASQRRSPAALLSRSALLAFVLSLAVHSRGGHGRDSADAFVASLVRQATPIVQEPPAASSEPVISPSPSPASSAAADKPSSSVGSSGTSPGVSDTQPEFVKPTLEECRPAMLRMEVVLLIELLLEAVFVFVGCIILHDRTLRKKLKRWFTTMRVVYLLPVAALNLSIIWLGGAPTGSCLQYHEVVRLLYVHLGLYLLYNVLLVGLSFLGSRTCQQCTGGRVDDDCTPKSEACDPRSNWGKGGDAVAHQPDGDSAYMYEYAEEDPPRCQIDCCGLFRFEP